MAKKRNKRAAKRRTSKEVAVDRPSQATYTNRRDAKIANLYFVHRLTQPPAIFDELLNFCRECGERKSRHEEMIGQDAHGAPIRVLSCTFASLITTNRDSGLRMIQSVVKRIREQAEPEEILKLRRPVETEKVRRTFEHLLQVELDVIHDRSLEKRQKMSPKGSLVWVLEPRYSETDKARAKKNARDINEKLGRLEGAILIAIDEPDHDAANGDGSEKQRGFSFNFPNVKGTPKDLDTMIAMNLDHGKVN